jgi:hypothetical protein
MTDTPKDLQDGYWSVENIADWIKCPHCDSENVEMRRFGHSDLRPIVDCQDCPADGYFD